MAVSPNSTAPYAPPSAVMEVVNRFRRGLPAPITGDVLGRAGVSDSLIPRTLQALQILDLIDAEGQATPTLEGLRRAPEAEFQSRLANWLNAAYADVLQYLDPATADEGAIRDAFRNYNPVGQQSRMVTLFSGLYAAAGIGTAKPSTPRAATPKPRQAGPRVVQRSAANPKPKGATVPLNFTGMHPMLMALLHDLPAPGAGWTQEQRDKVANMFPTVLDFAFPIIEKVNDAHTGDD